MTNRDRSEAAIANRLGALAGAIDDRTSEAMAAATGRSASANAALSALHHFLAAPSIELLRQVLGLTHSATVRLVDKLEMDGLVARRPGTDARSAAVALTARGKRAAQRASDHREETLVALLAPLDNREKALLDRLIGKVLAEMKRGPGATRWICRYCDTEACGLEAGHCPLGGPAFSIADNVAAVEASIRRG